MISFGPECSCTPGGMLWYVLILSIRTVHVIVYIDGTYWLADIVYCLANLLFPPFLFFL